jgi:mannitol/fructose-specific phosphotransferase system IIA component (Ntr-type)
MKLIDALIRETIIYPLNAESKSFAIKELLNCLQKNKFLTTTTKLFSFIEDHDKLLNPAVGRGIAYHYASSIEVNSPIAAFGISQNGLDYNSPDGQKVHYIFLILDSVNEPVQHRKLITRFQLFINDIDVKSKILSSSSSQNIIDIIKQWEEDYFLDEGL